MVKEQAPSELKLDTSVESRKGKQKSLLEEMEKEYVAEEVYFSTSP